MFSFSKTVRVTQADQELAYGLSEAMEEIKQLRQQVAALTAALTRLDQSTKMVQRPVMVKNKKGKCPPVVRGPITNSILRGSLDDKVSESLH